MDIEPQARAERDTLPVGALILLALTGFTAILTETLPAGLLPQVADDLNISRALAGQMVTVYAVGSVMAAIPLVSVTQSYARKPLLLAAIFGLLVFDVVTALSHSYAVTLVARFAAGVPPRCWPCWASPSPLPTPLQPTASRRVLEPNIDAMAAACTL